MEKRTFNWGDFATETISETLGLKLTAAQKKSLAWNMERWADQIEADQRRRISKHLLAKSAKDGTHLEAASALIKAARQLKK